MACRSLYLTHTPTSPKYSINYEHNQLKMCGLTFMTCDGCSKHINTIFQSAVALCMLMLCKHTTTHHWVARLRPDNTSWLTDPLLPVAFCCAPTSQWTGSSAPPLRSRTSRCSGLSSALHRPTVCLNRRTSNKTIGTRPSFVGPGWRTDSASKGSERSWPLKRIFAARVQHNAPFKPPNWG